MFESLSEKLNGLTAQGQDHEEKLTALNVLASALVAGLVELGIDAGWSALIVGVLFAVIAGLLAKKGLNDLKLKSLAPTRTAKNVRRDGEAVKEAV